MHSCSSMAIYPSLPSSLPLFSFIALCCSLEGSVFITPQMTSCFLSRSQRRGSQMIVVTCQPFFFSTVVFSVMRWLCWHHKSHCKKQHLLSCRAVHISTEYMRWFAKAALLNEAFNGLSIMFWWLGSSWSISILATHSSVPQLTAERATWTL